MTNWRVKVKGIKILLTEDDSDENATKVGKEVYKILSNSVYKKYFKNFDRLEDFNNVFGVDDFNDILNNMYDYCDDNGIWIDFD